MEVVGELVSLFDALPVLSDRLRPRGGLGSELLTSELTEDGSEHGIFQHRLDEPADCRMDDSGQTGTECDLMSARSPYHGLTSLSEGSIGSEPMFERSDL